RVSKPSSKTGTHSVKCSSRGGRQGGFPWRGRPAGDAQRGSAERLISVISADTDRTIRSRRERGGALRTCPRGVGSRVRVGLIFTWERSRSKASMPGCVFSQFRGGVGDLVLTRAGYRSANPQF